MQSNFPPGLTLNLVNIAKCNLDKTWNYSDIISPFSRIYLILKGRGVIFPNNKRTVLEEGYLYLIPSYDICSYKCPDFIHQYYLHFTNESNDGLNIYDYCSVVNKIKATDTDYHLFARLLQLNPNAALQALDPKSYQNKIWTNTTISNLSFSHYLETVGIIYQLLSRFVDPNKNKISNTIDVRFRFKQILGYIQQNIEKPITIKELASRANLSTDHFTRLFKQALGINPIAYINVKRIEKAQLLMVTTDLPLKEIMEKVGINSASYFNRIFKNITGTIPSNYKKNQIDVK